MPEKLDMPENAVRVHNHGFVALRHVCASDTMVVDAARVSHSMRSSGRGEDAPADHGVINYMMKNKHGSPFEHNHFQFHIKGPIFVFREWHRHRIGISINEESGRYVELKPEFYLPDDDHVRVQVGKPGKYQYVKTTTLAAATTRMFLADSYETAYANYRELIYDGIAREIARLALPVATYSQMIWSCNARSLMAFLALRNAETAQREIKDYAIVLETFFAEHMPVTYDAFVANGRVAP